jgi:hypothetical protein
MYNVWWIIAGAALVFLLALVRGLCHVAALADRQVERWERELIAGSADDLYEDWSASDEDGIYSLMTCLQRVELKK